MYFRKNNARGMFNQRCDRWQLFDHVPSIVLIVVVWAVWWPVSIEAQVDSREKFDKSLQEWQDIYVDIFKTDREFKTCLEEDSEEIRKRFLRLKEQGDAAMDRTILAAIECVALSTTPDPQLLEFLDGMPQEYYEQCRYASSAAAAEALMKHDPDSYPLVFNALRSSFFSNRFERAGQLFKEIESRVEWLESDGSLPEVLVPLYETFEALNELWKREKELRTDEALRNDLPRLAFETSKGTIVVELFRDQHPQLVDALIELVENEENEFFNNSSFFRVLKHQFASTGSSRSNPNQAGSLGPVSKEDEMNARGNFHGSFSMDIGGGGANKILTTRCQFVHIPNLELNKLTLVMGRVVEGMDVVGKLQSTSEFDPQGQEVRLEAVIPDQLLRVNVLRK